MVKWRVLHIISLRRTFDQSLMNIFSRIKEILFKHEFQDSNSWSSAVNLTLNRHGWAMRSAHQPAKASICPKYNENPSKGKGDMERTWNSMKFNCDWILSLHCLVGVSVHRLPEVNIWTSLDAFPCKGNRNMEGVQNSKFLNSWPSIVTLTFREHGWSDGVCTSPYWRYDQSLMKILPRWQRYGMEQNSRLKLVTFSCDLDLESAWLSYRFCIAFYCREHFT